MKEDYLTAAKLIQMITDFAKQSGQSLDDCYVTIQKLKNVGVRSMWYKHNPKTHTIDKTKPYIDWMDESYNCGISKTKKAVFEENEFDWPEYCTYWDGKKWKNI